MSAYLRLLRLQSAHILLCSFFSSPLMVAWFLAAVCAAALVSPRRDIVPELQRNTTLMQDLQNWE